MAHPPHLVRTLLSARATWIAACVAIALLVPGLGAAQPAGAAFSFRGNFAADDDVQIFTFVVGGESPVTLVTYSYAGGTQADGTVIPRGGFDPILALFDAAGNLIGQNDDGGGGNVPTDPVTGRAYDTFLQTVLSPGEYSVAVMQYNNFAAGQTLAEGFARVGQPFFTAAWGCSNGQFCDVGASNRTSSWAFDILGVLSIIVDENDPVCSLAESVPGTFTGTARDDQPSEDTNGDGVLGEGEVDLNGNGYIDEDSGILSVQLLEGAKNLTLEVDPFDPGAASVAFQIEPTDPEASFSGTVRASDRAGNTCERTVAGNFPSIAFGDWAEDVEVHVGLDPGAQEMRTAYVALQNEGVKILDVSDPDAIAILGSYAPATCANGSSTAAFFADDVEFVEELSALFVAVGRCGVLVLDVTNPAFPGVRGYYNTPVWAEAVEVDLSSERVIGYIADHTGGLVIVDFTNLFNTSPSAPVRLGGIGSSTTGWGTGAAIDVAFFDDDGDLLVFVAASQGLRVVRVNTPSSPQLIGSFDTSPGGTPPEVPQDITLSDDGNTAFLAGWQAGLLAIDVSIPTAPALLNRISTSPGLAYYESEVAGDFVFATEGRGGCARSAGETEGSCRSRARSRCRSRAAMAGPGTCRWWTTSPT